MPIPYQARLDERAFLNYPGFHGGAYVIAYVEDTSERDFETHEWLPRRVPPTPRLILEIADCTNRINLEFGVDSAACRENSLHKVEVLLDVLEHFREALEIECRLFAERESADAHAPVRRAGRRLLRIRPIGPAADEPPVRAEGRMRR